MEKACRAVLESFDEHTLPDLDVVTCGALELFADTPPPALDLAACAQPIVLGSGNAEAVGRIIFQNHDALFASESTYTHALAKARSAVENAVIISASGSKHAVELVEALQNTGLSPWLYTTEGSSEAANLLDDGRVLVFPKNREPYTYNTSTYMGMLFAYSGEDPEKIHHFIETVVDPALSDTLSMYDAFYFLIPSEYVLIKDMFLTKFDELFGGRVSGRAFTMKESMHAKTVVPYEKECFISFGQENVLFGDADRRVHIPLPDDVGYAGMMAIGYYVIGQIQKQHPPYFKDALASYVAQASEMFNTEITSIVE